MATKTETEKVDETKETEKVDETKETEKDEKKEIKEETAAEKRARIDKEEYEKAMKPTKVKLFKDNNEYKDDVFVSVNGNRVQIQRGVEVELPYYLAQSLEMSQKQDQHTADMIQQITSEYQAKN